MILVSAFLPVFACALSDLEHLPIEKGDTGSPVVSIQQRLIELGFLHFRATGTYGDMTVAGVRAFQKRNGLENTGIINEETYKMLFSKTVQRAAVSGIVARVAGPRTVAKPPEYGKLTPWREINTLFPIGETVTITDLYTGNTFRIIREGGQNHATVKAASIADHNTYIKCFGNSYTWEKRPVLVEIAGEKHAASLFGMPNGAASNVATRDVEMPGVTELYFFESASDIGNIVDVEHETVVYTASSAVGSVK